MTDVDPFDEGVPRGRYGRPLIIPAGRGGKPNLKAALVEYDRASTVAGALDTGDGLAKWQTRHAAVGIARNPDLAAMVAALGPNPDNYEPADKAALDEVIERAHDRSGGNEKADYGTAVHALTEPGRDAVVIVDSMAADAASYDATLDAVGIEVEASETFVVNDDLKVAGTFDHTYRFTRDLTVKLNDAEVTIPAGTKVIGDKKTGSLHFDAHAIQLAIYARGKVYDHVTGQRTALDVSPLYGVVAHVAREGAETTLYLVDIADGWKGARLACEVRAYTLGAKKRLAAAIATCKAPGETQVSFEVAEPAPADPFDAVADKVAATLANLANVAASGSPGPQRVTVEPEPATPPGMIEHPQTVGDALTNLAAAGLLDREQPDVIMAAIAAAGTADALHEVWRQYRASWTDAHTEVAKKAAAKLRAA